jgi:hypothetical protein
MPDPAEKTCTCFRGHPDHDGDCGCTTTIMDCAVHGMSDIGLIERAVTERWYAPEG